MFGFTQSLCIDDECNVRREMTKHKKYWKENRRLIDGICKVDVTKENVDLKEKKTNEDWERLGGGGGE